jgi:hypothetical protein
MEAGDPFLDVNGNGKWDSNEPYINVDGSVNNSGKPTYTPPIDQLWSTLTALGAISEPITFDYTNGYAVPLYKSTIAGGVRNLESQARQLYARHLYCLMLLLADENYIAPWDENDPQLLAWMDSERKKLTSPPTSMAAGQADFIVKRKATCRTIAQWAINCADMRDSDVIETPFEYDENPWDGWGTLDQDGNVIPIDGDIATDENKGEMIDWARVPNGRDGQPNTADDYSKVIAPSPASGSLPAIPSLVPSAKLPTVVNQTRGVVWGAERPELLITETLALHDRRTEDLAPPNGGHDTVTPQHQNDPKYYRDTDLDQSLRPRGSLFVEIFNPSPADGQHPAELYRYPGNIPHLKPNGQPYLDPATGKPIEGVLLNRLSDFGVDGNGNLTMAASNGVIKRSPVWKLIVVEEWPDSRNSDAFDDSRSDKVDTKTHQPYTFPATNEPQIYKDIATKVKNWTPSATQPNPPFRPTDPDFPIEPGQTNQFDPNFIPKQVGTNNQFQIQYPYVEREVYFTTDKSPTIPTSGKQLSPTKLADWDYSATQFKLRIPDRSIQVTTTPGTIPTKVQTQKFIPLQVEKSINTTANDPIGAAIAPIAPGHYGVIGSATTNYSLDPTNPYINPNNQVYTTTIGRNNLATGSGSKVDGNDTFHKPLQTRRIELRPNADPTVQQLVVAGNGGDPKDEGPTPNPAGGRMNNPFTKEIGRDNELIRDMTDNTVPQGTVKNIFDSRASGNTPTGTPNSRYYQPCVGIPVEGLNVSEPPWGYGPREKEAASEQQQPDGLPSEFRWSSADKYEGRYYFSSGGGGNQIGSYDKPFDTTPELMRTGTTANYRTVHLQRLANPLLPWNPERWLADGTTQNPDWKPNLPINPYRTVDSSSVNLTAFCGTSLIETDLDNQKKTNEGKFRPWILGTQGATELLGYLNNYSAGKQIWYFRSLERGFWSRLNYLGSNPPAGTAPTSLPQRILWAQEPAMIKLTHPGANPPDLYDLVAGREMTMRGDEIPDEVRQSQNVMNNNNSGNLCNMVLQHTLGFGNASWGLLYDAQGAKQAGTPAGSPTSSAAPAPLTAQLAGAPAPSRFIFSHNVDSTGNVVGTPPTVNSTNPWLAWDNRPYISGEEILKVPAASQTKMLQMYSTIDPNAAAANRRDPYGLDAIGTKQNPVTNLIRWAFMPGPFGELANVFAASTDVADVVRDASGVPALFDRKTGLTPPTSPDQADVKPYGAPNFSRILEYVQVPSRFVGTDTMLNAETFNDVPVSTQYPTEPVGTDISGPTDPRYNFQPPFNKVSRERDPGRVNLNTVTGRRSVVGGIPHVWSEVFDGIMHRFKNPVNGAGDDNLRDNAGNTITLGQPGPAWRDVVLSRRGYAQYNADPAITSVDKPGVSPDIFQFGLNNNFPTFFANPFRSPDAGDLVPLTQMMQIGVDASLDRVHPRNRGFITDSSGKPIYDPSWGDGTAPVFGDARDAGFGNDGISVRPNGAIPNTAIIQDPKVPNQRDTFPLFSESRNQAFADTNRNPYMMYEPLARIDNLVTNRSGVFAVWITVGYFEVEKAPDWNDPDPTVQANIRAHFGGDINLYNRVYPDGYMLGKELGSETGDVQRPRGFYIIDRTEEVGFKPGEDINVEKTVRLRRRIE